MCPSSNCSWYGKLLREVSAQSFNNLGAPLPTTVERDPLAVERSAAAFDEVKRWQSPNLLVHFDRDKQVVLACDTSPYGVGAVLSYPMEDGTDCICLKKHYTWTRLQPWPLQDWALLLGG